MTSCGKISRAAETESETLQRNCGETGVGSGTLGVGAEASPSSESGGRRVRGEPLVLERKSSPCAQADNQFPTEFQQKDLSFHTVSPGGLFIMILTTRGVKCVLKMLLLEKFGVILPPPFLLVCWCVYVCVRERETDRWTDRHSEMQKQRERERAREKGEGERKKKRGCIYDLNSQIWAPSLSTKEAGAAMGL